MFFEGTEKKIEIIFSKEVNIKKKLEPLWIKILALADIKILSCIKNKDIDAYLLSESSLFVWQNRILMITCGQSKLINSIEYILQTIDEQNIDFLVYERKNEYLPLKQKTSFKNDLSILNKYLKGQDFLLGDPDAHYMSAYHLNKTYYLQASDHTTQILISGLSKQASKLFSSSDKKMIFDKLNLSSIFNNYLIDDYVFSPLGYSINAIKQDYYYTIHITPQKQGSYVSFESNQKINKEQDLACHFIDIFEPKTLEWISYIPKDQNKKSMDLKNKNYFYTKTFSKNLNQAYKSIFTSYSSTNPKD